MRARRREVCAGADRVAGLVPEVEAVVGMSAKPTPWHTDDPKLFHHFKAVEQVHLHAFSLRDKRHSSTTPPPPLHVGAYEG